MARFDPLDFSQLRMAPIGVVRELEDIEPSLGLLHSRGSRWLLCQFTPDYINTSVALEQLARWRHLVANGLPYSHEAHVRIRQHRLALRGWKQLAVYVVHGDNFGFVVNDVRAARWMRNHTSENELFAEIDRGEYERRESARAEIASLDRAKDAWQYAFTRSHLVGGTLTPQDRPKAGWTRHGVTGPVLHS